MSATCLTFESHAGTDQQRESFGKTNASSKIADLDKSMDFISPTHHTDQADEQPIGKNKVRKINAQKKIPELRISLEKMDKYLESTVYGDCENNTPATCSTDPVPEVSIGKRKIQEANEQREIRVPKTSATRLNSRQADKGKHRESSSKMKVSFESTDPVNCKNSAPATSREDRATELPAGKRNIQEANEQREKRVHKTSATHLTYSILANTDKQFNSVEKMNVLLEKADAESCENSIPSTSDADTATKQSDGKSKTQGINVKRKSFRLRVSLEKSNTSLESIASNNSENPTSATCHTDAVVEQTVAGKPQKRLPFCLYCRKSQTQFARHLKVHKRKQWVNEYFKADKKDKNVILSYIRNKGYEALEKQTGIITPVKAVRKDVITEKVPCKYCGGRFSKETLKKHEASCYGKPRKSKQKQRN